MRRSISIIFDYRSCPPTSTSILIEDFPPTSNALVNPNGLLAVGGDLSSERMLLAYSRGIFPWYSKDDPVLWWSPDPRSVLLPNEFHLSKSLRKSLKNKNYTVFCNTEFEAVMRACAAPRKDGAGTWISEEMIAAYTKLHQLGFAHSIEIFFDDDLVGGLYGVKLGRVFFGESMFSRATDASKTALTALAWLARQGVFDIIDCQMESTHLTTLGATSISRRTFEGKLSNAINVTMVDIEVDWTQVFPLPAAELLLRYNKHDSRIE